MKYFLFAIILFAFFSCNNQDTESLSEDSDLTTLSGQENTENLPVDFPLVWSMLTQTDTGYVLFYPCDADDRRMEFRKEEGKDVLLIGWGQDATEHPVDSVVKEGRGAWSVYARFGENPFRIDVSVIDMEKMITSWSWNWIVSYDGKKESYNMIMAPDNLLDIFTVYRQPCSECWEPEMCTDYIEKHIGHTVEDLFLESAFVSRINNTFADEYSDILTLFNLDDKIKLQEDRYITLYAKHDNKDEFDELVLVIDIENNSITVAYAKNGHYLFALSEVEEKQYPSPVFDWISDRN